MEKEETLWRVRADFKNQSHDPRSAQRIIADGALCFEDMVNYLQEIIAEGLDNFNSIMIESSRYTITDSPYPYGMEEYHEQEDTRQTIVWNL